MYSETQAIGLGRMCIATEMLLRLGWKKKSYPLDWARTGSLYETYGLLAQNDFDGFFDLVPHVAKDGLQGYRNTRYPFVLYHDRNPNSKAFMDFMPRRIKRFMDVLSNPDIFTILIAYRIYDTNDWEKSLEVFRSKFNNHRRSIVFCVEPGKEDAVNFYNIEGYRLVVLTAAKPEWLSDWNTLHTGYLNGTLQKIRYIADNYI